jgi:hypothetical protein
MQSSCLAGNLPLIVNTPSYAFMAMQHVMDQTPQIMCNTVWGFPPKPCSHVAACAMAPWVGSCGLHRDLLHTLLLLLLQLPTTPTGSSCCSGC